MEAEQSSNNREHPVVFGQKRAKMSVGQSDMVNNTFCRYCIQVHPFLARKAPKAPVSGHCPFYFEVQYKAIISTQDLHSKLSFTTVVLSVDDLCCKKKFTAKQVVLP